MRLLAEDIADLDVIAAAAQDALVRVGDLTFDKKARRFSALLNRFRWEKADGHGPYERIRAGLAFEGVLSVKSRKIRTDAPDAFASLLSLKFIPAEEPPAGVVRLIFAGDGEIMLDVECLDVVLADVGDPWPTPRRPDHEKAQA
ncbi:MAG TPA: DUF2948 family protein [Caulobacterales bacterium]|nr:DUF2948 family protein [Caulobacterales bacterium]